jgi:regulatory protein
MNPSRLTPQQALQKIRHYCAYQERCHSEVKSKLFEYGLNTVECEEIIMSLIADNYLNEERFAIQFAGGHFRNKKWGRNKIKYALRIKKVSDYCIRKAMLEIEDAAYMETLEALYAAKKESLKSVKPPLLRRKKIQDYLVQKGYEQEYIRRLLD